MVAEFTKRYYKRKQLEIGGFTNEEISSITPKELEFIIKRLIKKGHFNGTNRVDNVKGENDAAQAWMDALAIYETAPAASDMKDRSIVFPVYSGVFAWLKGGKIRDGNAEFELNLAKNKF